jgi:hypothetical protein
MAPPSDRDGLSQAPSPEGVRSGSPFITLIADGGGGSGGRGGEVGVSPIAMKLALPRVAVERGGSVQVLSPPSTLNPEPCQIKP